MSDGEARGRSTSGFDVHANRHRLKLKRDAGNTTLFENRDDVACPACSDPFDELLTTDRPTYSFDAPDEAQVCLVREPDRLLVLTHR